MSIYLNNYYVYAYLRENGLPYYIGKGKNRRAYQPHRRKDGVSIKIPPKERIVIVEQNLTNVGASAIERRLIRWYGKKIDNTGILVNILDGGDGGGVKGSKLSEEHKQKISQTLTGRKHSAYTINKRALSGTGLKRTEDSKHRMSNAQKGKTLSEDTRKNMSLAAKNRTLHGNTGKKNVIVVCPHCSKSGGAGVMQRWHFNKCKLKSG